MISNRMKNKYTLKRKRHILRKKEHVGEKYLADFSGNRKFLSVISVLVLVTAIRQTSAAQDLGGFHVETLPGESTGIPSDWEVGDGDQDFGEQQQSEENGYEDMFGSGEESWQGEIYEEPETVPESGNVSDWENSMENMEETDEEYLEEIRNQSGAEQQKNLSETGGTNRDGTEDLQDMPSDRERLPVTIVSPTAAAATIISQFVSAFLCLNRLTRKSPEEYRVSLRKIQLNPVMLRQIISNGLPAGIQNSIISLANVVVQSNINSFGKLAVAGCGSYSKVEGFGFLPITCFSMSLTTFISQNLGAKKYDRAKKGARFGITCSLIMAECIGIIIYFASPVLIAAFNSDPDVVAFGVQQARTVTLFYFLLAFSHCLAGLLRGAGKSIIPMFVMMICWCIIRVSYITIIVKLIPSIQVIFWAYPLTWTLSSIVFLIFYLKSDWLHFNSRG